MIKLACLQLIFIILAFAWSSCNAPVNEENEVLQKKIPVKIETPVFTPMNEVIELPAVSGYLKKETLRAQTSGFISELLINLGDKVQEGELILTLKTKEASALKSIPGDSVIIISGLNQIKARTNGIITSIEHHPGDFVSEGDPLVVVAQPSSLVFYLKVPYSEHEFLKFGETYPLQLPDGTKITGKLSRALPAVDPGSQSQDYLIEPNSLGIIPENLWIRVPVNIQSHTGNFVLPKTCIQGNETQSEFWVMKLINDSLAVKVKIKKGIESDSMIEILYPAFDRTDRFVSLGSYGLPDSSRIEIIK